MTIRPSIQALVDRGNVTPHEVADLRCNSWEWEALIPAMNDEAFVAFVDRALQNVGVNQPRPFSTYDESVKGLLAPELLKRFQKKIQSPKPGETGASCTECGMPADRQVNNKWTRCISCGAARALQPIVKEIWVRRIFPDWEIVSTHNTEAEAREMGGGGYRIEGPYRWVEIGGDK